ncbi:MAG: hypothetical protein KA765_17320 [Thermoflexales bacterium]|nr:hypothetical protein [Thermoflexales bacterium]
MRKLTMLAVVVAIMAAAVVSIVPALCANGGDTCDLTTALRGSVRLASGELCKSQPTAPGCQLASVAGLKKR